MPPLQAPPVAPVTVPLRVIAGLFAHTEPLAPAFTMGAGVMVITLVALALLQVPLPVVVRVSVTVPAAISAADGV